MNNQILIRDNNEGWAKLKSSVGLYTPTSIFIVHVGVTYEVQTVGLLK